MVGERVCPLTSEKDTVTTERHDEALMMYTAGRYGNGYFRS